MDTQLITKARDQNYYQLPKHNRDPWFWCHFHVDWYCLVAKSRKNMVVPMKSINWTYMWNKNHLLFNEIIQLVSTTRSMTSWPSTIRGMIRSSCSSTPHCTSLAPQMRHTRWPMGWGTTPMPRCLPNESASRPPCGFWRIDDQQLEN
jgi:hypothetical protein